MVQAAARRPLRRDGRAPGWRATFPMVKLEASGNDFLVVLDAQGTGDAGDPRGADLVGDIRGAAVAGESASGVGFTPAQVRALCDRRRGVGSDGLIVGRPAAGDADLEMVLYNADGSEAEMSGNGIRCLVHAAVVAGVVPVRDVRVATAAGLRTVAYEPADDGGAWARVRMGPVRLGEEVASPLPRTRARLANVGNPHLVVAGDVDLGSVDLDSLGAGAARAAGAPVNLEVVRPGLDGADLALRVFERGVGETLACGTGSCAAAAVARAWGMAGDTVTVDNPGGRLEVRLGPARTADGDGTEVCVDEVELGGPVRKVADVEVDAAFLVRATACSAADGEDVARRVAPAHEVG